LAKSGIEVRMVWVMEGYWVDVNRCTNETSYIPARKTWPSLCSLHETHQCSLALFSDRYNEFHLQWTMNVESIEVH
jgi:hypothetical protein